jgi:hypothetical protein
MNYVGNGINPGLIQPISQAPSVYGDFPRATMG